MEYDERDPELVAESRQQRRAWHRMGRCLCGNPDWPGACPGPDLCPVHGEASANTVLRENSDG